ncbi:nine-cis-epoxycarotenoid dioxygenase 4 [Perilla frutescens var. hirtella]|uniref:Nine-cis-epoxycarotenoid dioxygenase 4 n=1 Tax=Perilla frutescens var. hirtella TaxID=608512 RepID=A0AAD4IS40_PERFH|nr:nine-cis-epoxycarotenoid dioxygenase 4 [Perilla frutescens var. hirtella]
MDLPLTPSIDPNHILSDSFAPMAELSPTVEGSLPAYLDGAYIHNGPNPQFIPRPMALTTCSTAMGSINSKRASDFEFFVRRN